MEQATFFLFWFNSNVWGTVSDWIMIIVTSITAVLLLKSFSAQKTSNEISYKNYRKTIRPYFSVTIESEEFGVGNFKKFLTLKVNDNNAFDLQVVEFKTDYIVTLDFIPSFMSTNQEYSVEINEKGLTTINQEPEKIAMISFKDTEGNNYMQEIFVYNIGDFYISGVEDLLVSTKSSLTT
ncbi:hypothetical protein [Sphingobacterium hungaricum]|uniref:Uncharacterized protein n=1 Tax=Sphingobacterium hungaricum TaxID=2082723 RepID=A0A928YQM4_9SPHI|nr:hypothetical protein [Sphingobacterium hungaricum]MBE8712513.1 hypothetical protein [Sphingobacterium hungaricum]